MIKKIVLEVGGKEVELRLDEAKSLHEQLNDLFSKESYPVFIETSKIENPCIWPWTSPTISYKTSSTAGGKQ